jgi:hypothetical protein
MAEMLDWMKDAIDKILPKREMPLTEEEKEKQRVMMEEVEPHVKALFELCKAKGVDCIIGIDCGTKAIQAYGNFTGRGDSKFLLALKALSFTLPKEKEKVVSKMDDLFKAFITVLKDTVGANVRVRMGVMDDGEE